MALYLYPHIC